MGSVFTIGETIYDIIFRGGQPVAASPGGSMLNTAVSLGRCGLQVKMITELGDDKVGKIILHFLEENGVSTSFIKPVAGFRTPVSLAFLDDEGNADYSFYKYYPDGRLNILWPEAEAGDVVLFGSFYSLDLAIRSKIISFIKKAKQKGAFIIYDPNIRKNHLNEIRKLMRLVRENISLADIVRGSDEDFINIFGTRTGDQVFDRLNDLGCKNLIYTCSDHGADLITEKIRFHSPAKIIKIVSTIGAGDGFNAGIIFGLVKLKLVVGDLMQLNEKGWEKIIGYGIDFSAEVCGSYGNYIKSRK